MVQWRDATGKVVELDGVILLIGGAARTGKGILARRLLMQQHLPYLSLDVLKMGLTRGVPEYAIDPDAGALQVAERLWPLVREMCGNLIAEQHPYVIEGELLPKNVALLRQAHPAAVSACFLGYTLLPPQQKVQLIRAHSGHANDWPGIYTDAELLPIIVREIAFSHYLQDECAAYGLPYFDTSHDFAAAQDKVAAYAKASFAKGPPPAP